MEFQQLRWIDPEPVITDADHRDPVSGYKGRWLVGFAPVGGVGFVVIVQTRYDAAIARLWRRLVFNSIVAIVSCLAAGLASA